MEFLFAIFAFNHQVYESDLTDNISVDYCELNRLGMCCHSAAFHCL